MKVRDAFQMPFAAKLLAMSQTVDVVVAAHGKLPEAAAKTAERFLFLVCVLSINSLQSQYSLLWRDHRYQLR